MTEDAAKYLASLGSRYRSGHASFEAQSLECINVSFSIGGEDLFLRKRLKNRLSSKEHGTYVDIGAFHPFLGSNTYVYYAGGWSGICVDANPALRDVFVQARPRDLFISGAVMEHPKDTLFARHKENTGKSSIFDDASKITSDFDQPVMVSAQRLDDILDTHLESGRYIDFMNVDTEGTELTVLRSNNWDRYRPGLLCIELHGIGLTDLADAPLVNFLGDVGYSAYALAAPNIFFEDITRTSA